MFDGHFGLGVAVAISLACAPACVRDAAVDEDDVSDTAASAPLDTDAAAGGADAAQDSGGGGGGAQVDVPLAACGPLALDAGGDTAAMDAAKIDVGPVTCTPGEAHCEGMKLATCAPAGDGWGVGPCFPGSHCSAGACVPIANNLIIVFDTSGSMGTPLPGKQCPEFVFPKCEQPDQPCTRMGLSKQVFAKALVKIDPTRTRMALFRFPQIPSANVIGCKTGYYEGVPRIAGDKDEHTVGPDTAWYWQGLDQVRCVDFPKAIGEDPKPAMAKWMDGQEVKGIDPELRTTGGTPIGNTLFYVGEYLRSRVFVDGRQCSDDADCMNPNYSCQGGVCVDPARDCRETAVVLYTDGGEVSDPKEFRSPRVQARRLAFGLGCSGHEDCVGGAICHQGRCQPPDAPCFVCFPGGGACEPGVTDKSDPLYCPWTPPLALGMPSCIPDPISAQIAVSSVPAGNVLRSPDGTPFGVRVHVVDISGTPSQMDSFALAIAGNGRLLAADSADPDRFLQTLESAFDMKNQKICGVTY